MRRPTEIILVPDMSIPFKWRGLRRITLLEMNIMAWYN